MRAIALAAILTVSLPLAALDHAAFDAQKKEFDLTGRVAYYFEDYNEQLPHEALDLLQKGYFTHSPSARLSLGYVNRPVWIAVPYESKDLTSQIFLELTALIDSIQFSHLTDRGLILDSFRTGRDFGLSTRPISHHNFVFPVKPSRSGRGFILMRLVSQGSMLVPLRLVKEIEFNAQNHREQFIFGIYFGLMLVMVLYNFFLYGSTRDRSYAFYVFYILFFLLFQFSLWGFTHEMILPEKPVLAKYSLPIFLHLATLFQLLFASQFFQSKHLIPRLYKLSGILSLITFVSLSIGGFIPYRYFVTVGIFSGTSAALIIFIMGLWLYIKKVKAARFFLMAYTMLIVGVIFLTLRNLGILNYSFVTTYSAQLGSAVEVVLLSLALADKINIWRNEKEAAQKQVIDREREMNRAFQLFVPQKFLELAGETDFTKLTLGKSTTRDVTILFSDIRGFTTLSESMPPEQNFKFLNSYLSRMGPIIRAHGGFIDKFIGDAIMALFPEDAARSVDAALAMRRELKNYNEHRLTQGYAPIDIGIGMHFGTVRLGTIGENERWEGTVIGDAVNTASRVEGLTAVLSVPIIITEALLLKLNNPPQIRELDAMRVKGKKQAITIYEVIEGG